MQNLYVLMGKSLSGKTYCINQLQKDGIASRLITNTSRPKRPYESGNEYHFVTDLGAQKDAENGIALAGRNYKVASGDIWRYYINKNNLDKQLKTSALPVITILDYKGYQDLQKAIKGEYNVIGIYLDVDLDTRLKRYISTPRKNDNPKEFVRRLYDDEFNAFNGIENDKSVNIVNNYYELKALVG